MYGKENVFVLFKLISGSEIVEGGKGNFTRRRPYSYFCGLFHPRQYLMVVAVWSGSHKKLPPVTFYHTPDRHRSIEGIMAENGKRKKFHLRAETICDLFIKFQQTITHPAG